MDNKEGKGKWYLSNGEVFEGHFKAICSIS